MKKIRIGAGAGYAGDRIEPAIELKKKGKLDYIIFECLAERTIAMGQQQKLKDQSKGYNELLEYRMKHVVPLCKKNKIKVITNMGSANPVAAAKKVSEIAKELGIEGLKIAAVLGDDIFGNIDKYMDYKILETGEKLEAIKEQIVSANAYIGTQGIIEALNNGADIIITGRVADPSLTLAPLMFEFGWNKNNYELLGKGTLAGHLLECAGQVTGGYYADPGYKDVPELWNLGFPIAEVSEDGEIVITKLEDAGGMVTEDTCKEQIIYEIHDPENYFTPDVIADFSKVTITEIEKDKVLVKGASGKAETGLFKTSVGYKDCYIGEGEMSYGGSGAYERAVLAGEIIKKRLEHINAPIEELRVDLIGVNSLYKDSLSNYLNEGKNDFKEVRLRVAGRTLKKEDAAIIGNEVEALYTNGPAGGGGARKGVKEIVSVASIFVPNEDINIKVVYEEV
ncbi:acyclic terpene utilization AtuA family protein [uncultured Clostridium sp.]|uniref:acyclic terpene utilization AtuA family protein n=1 Tax=uncultured Clostridium sp. TaxID=59620 RepID=UPI0028E2D1F2|nr:acyclic terpene utilization AtuA family protein [uncultured Clostridium sp.]